MEDVQVQARARQQECTSLGLLYSVAPSPRRTPGWGWRESQLSCPRARRGRPWGEQMADEQRGLKEGTPSWAVAWGQAHVGGGRRKGASEGPPVRTASSREQGLAVWVQYRPGIEGTSRLPSSPHLQKHPCRCAQA